MRYFVIRGSEDGTIITPYDSEQKLLARIADDTSEERKPEYRTVYATELPKDFDTNIWPSNFALIIKGELISPEPEQVVKKWKLARVGG